MVNFDLSCNNALSVSSVALLSAQTTLVCGILLHVMGVSGKGDYICLSVVLVALDGQGQPSLSFPRPA